MAGSALIVIDLQLDFCPGGALAVAGGDEIVPTVNAMMDAHDAVVLTQDWHPADHLSFAANHPGAAPFSTTAMPYGPQVLWPAHCVIGSPGAGFHPGLAVDRADLVLRAGYLRERGLTRLTFAGLAQDFCVAWSALDAARLGFRATVAEAATRAIDLDGSLARARAELAQAGVDLA